MARQYRGMTQEAMSHPACRDQSFPEKKATSFMTADSTERGTPQR
jgi:hypothetical protein